MNKSKRKADIMINEDEKILIALQEIQQKLAGVRQAFEAATDEALVDSYIYEMIALNKKYEYYLKTARKMGLRAPVA
ncbi:MAG: DUF2508 family protein [Anaerotignum sp.]